jgi:hypothetical protein
VANSIANFTFKHTRTAAATRMRASAAAPLPERFLTGEAGLRTKALLDA